MDSRRKLIRAARRAFDFAYSNGSFRGGVRFAGVLDWKLERPGDGRRRGVFVRLFRRLRRTFALRDPGRSDGFFYGAFYFMRKKLFANPGRSEPKVFVRLGFGLRYRKISGDFYVRPRRSLRFLDREKL
jgi:hypothetical protein